MLTFHAGMQQLVLPLSFGAIIGFILGLLGGGGSVITIPILVYGMGLDVHSAIGTSLVIVGVNAMIGAVVYARNGNIRLKSGLIFGSMSMVGAIPGAWMNHFISGEIILLLFSMLMIAVAIGMLRNNRGQLKISVIPSKTRNNLSRLMLLGLGVGLLTGFFGVGGGFLIVPALILFGKFLAHQAVGTSLLIIAMASFSGFVGHVHMGAVDFRIAGLFILGGLAGSMAGISLAGKMPEEKLTRAFGWFIIVVALYVIYRSIT